MDELDLYYDALFKEGRKFERGRKSLLFGVLICLSISIYATGYLLYTTALAALMLQGTAWYLGILAKQNFYLGHEFQKLAILCRAYGVMPSAFELSHLKGRSSLAIAKTVFENSKKQKNPIEYNVKDTTSKEHMLRPLIQENAFWNHHLYEYTYKLYKHISLFLGLSIFLVTLFAVPFLKADPNYTLLRLVFTFLSFFIGYEILEATLRFSSASKEMLEIDNEISRLDDGDHPEAILRLFTKYNLLKISCPSIPQGIYERNRVRLNDSWDKRTSK